MLQELELLRTRLVEAEETLQAIRTGQVDALVVEVPEGEQVFTLQGAESSYRFLVEAMNEGALLLAPDGTILHANARFAQLAGVPLEQTIGQPWDQCFAPADRPRLRQLLEQARGASAQDELHLAGGNRTPCPVAVSLRSLQREQLQGFSVVVTDLTDRLMAQAALGRANETLERRVVERTTELHQANQALRLSEEKFAKAFSSNPAAISLTHLGGGHILEVNDTWSQLTGYSPEEVLGQSAASLPIWPSPEARAAFIQELLAQGSAQRWEQEFVHKSGQRFTAHLCSQLLSVQGEPVMLSTLVDITERKRVEAALRATQEQFRTLADSISNLAWWANPEGYITWYIRRWYEYTGTTAQQMEGWGWQSVHDPELLPQVLERWKASLATGQSFEMEFPLRGADGRFRWFLTRATPLRDAAGNIVRWFGTNTDVHNEREARLVLMRSKEDLERLVAERTAKLQELVGELEHFSYTITHDMRAPLRSMRGFAELVLDLGEATEHPEQKALLQRIVNSAQRMDLLITDALSYSKAVRQELPLGPVDLGALLRGMLDSYPEFQHTNACIQVQPDLPLVLGNQAGLTQCFSNLLTNALKFVRPGQNPEVRIWAEHLPAPTPAGPTAGNPASARIRIWVEDNGIGISEAMRPRIFNMFARGSHKFEGTGIGLALVRKVVDRMGGRVGVESEPGQGSRFWVELLAGDPRQTPPTILPTPPANCTTIL